MPAPKRNPNFINSTVGFEIRQLLEDMVLDGAFNTEPSYSANGDLYIENLIPFVDKHMNYLCNHPSMDPHHYIANLRLMTRLRTGPVAARRK
jgi:hypothetical protein